VSLIGMQYGAHIYIICTTHRLHLGPSLALPRERHHLPTSEQSPGWVFGVKTCISR